MKICREVSENVKTMMRIEKRLTKEFVYAIKNIKKDTLYSLRC